MFFWILISLAIVALVVWGNIHYWDSQLNGTELVFFTIVRTLATSLVLFIIWSLGFGMSKIKPSNMHEEIEEGFLVTSVVTHDDKSNTEFCIGYGKKNKTNYYVLFRKEGKDKTKYQQVNLEVSECEFEFSEDVEPCVKLVYTYTIISDAVWPWRDPKGSKSDKPKFKIVVPPGVRLVPFELKELF